MSTDVKEEPSNSSTVENTDNHDTETQQTNNENPPESTAVVNPTESTAVVDPPEITEMVNLSESSAVVNPTESTGVVNPTECSAVDNLLESTAMDNPPENTAVDDTPESTSVDNPPKSTAVNNPPESSAVNNPPESTAVVNPPESTTETKAEPHNGDTNDVRDGVENAEDIKSEDDEEEGSLLLDDFLDSLDVLDSWNPDEDELEGIGDDQTQTSQKDEKLKEDKPEKKEKEKKGSRRDNEDRRTRPGGSRRRSVHRDRSGARHERERGDRSDRDILDLLGPKASRRRSVHRERSLERPARPKHFQEDLKDVITREAKEGERKTRDGGGSSSSRRSRREGSRDKHKTDKTDKADKKTDKEKAAAAAGAQGEEKVNETFENNEIRPPPGIVPAPRVKLPSDDLVPPGTEDEYWPKEDTIEQESVDPSEANGVPKERDAEHSADKDGSNSGSNAQAAIKSTENAKDSESTPRERERRARSSELRIRNERFNASIRRVREQREVRRRGSVTRETRTRDWNRERERDRHRDRDWLSNSTARRTKSRSPRRTKSRSPRRTKSRSPRRTKSRSPRRTKSRSPRRTKSRSPRRTKSRSPRRRISRDRERDGDRHRLSPPLKRFRRIERGFERSRVVQRLERDMAQRPRRYEDLRDSRLSRRSTERSRRSRSRSRRRTPVPGDRSTARGHGPNRRSADHEASYMYERFSSPSLSFELSPVSSGDRLRSLSRSPSREFRPPTRRGRRSYTPSLSESSLSLSPEPYPDHLRPRKRIPFVKELERMFAGRLDDYSTTTYHNNQAAGYNLQATDPHSRTVHRISSREEGTSLEAPPPPVISEDKLYENSQTLSSVLESEKGQKGGKLTLVMHAFFV